MPLEHYAPFKWVMRPNDSKFEILKKKLIFTLYTVLFLLTIGSSLNFRTHRALFINLGINLPSCVGAVHMLVTRRFNIVVTEVLFYVLAVVFMFRYFSSVTFGLSSGWSPIIILIDLCLVAQLENRISVVLVFGTCVCFFVFAFEDMLRFGLYDVEALGVSSQKERYDFNCDCSTLPCKKTAAYASSNVFSNAVVLVFDYYFTRNFANSLSKRNSEMEKVVSAAENIAECLSRFDLGQAEAIIHSSHLPVPLHNAFTNILSNLHMYRPYLPQSCFLFNELAPSDSDTPTTEKGHSDVSDSKSSREQQPNRELLAAVEKRRCSFTVSNMLGSHELAAADITKFQEIHCYTVCKHLNACATHGGVVGVIMGDHIHASFNAVRRCSAHAKGAVEAALRINSVTKAAGLEVVTGVSSGQAYCGPFGCTELLTVATIGRASVVASLLETFGRVKGHKVVCSSSVYSDVSYAFVMRIIFGRVLYKGCVVFGYEVEAIDWDVNEEEWMYQIKGNEWDTYNESGRQYLNGEGDIATLSMSHGSSLVVQQHQDQVVEMLRSGEAVSVDVRVD
eukprot:TRINITY_DN3349_c0_g1_i4.p1 TRINITY_DN3349_c0_g1~~TRINITY_DN3349_c0_g1_i4.p1  ORF type:complete len:563 (+),score=101.04 TRINITY_DN3349_c0_g1_i4:287-1975(+)